MQDEGELIRAAADGDRTAFSTLVRLKRERIVRIAYQITGNWEDALDVSQRVFLKLWKSLGQFDLRRRFDTWLHRVTVNAAIDLIRSSGPKGILQPLPENFEPRADEGRAADRAIDVAELQQAFLRLAGGLGVKQRTAFVLKEIEGMETAEVARVMGVAESTVRNHLFQARRLLRRGLERDYPGLVPESARRVVGGDGPSGDGDDGDDGDGS